MRRTGVDPPDPLLNSQAVTGWISQLAGLRQDVSDAERIDQIRALER
jgi:hypothetical protein